MYINYQQILINIVQMLLHNKYLWFFGLFAAFLASDIVYQTDGDNFVNGWQRLQSTGIFDFSIFSKASEVAAADPTSFVVRLVLLIAVAVFSLFFLWLAIVSQGALIRSVASLKNGKSTDFADGLRAGKKHFWTVLSFRIMEKFVTIALASIVLYFAAILLDTSPSTVLDLLYALVTMIVLAGVIFLALSIRYAISYQVIKDMRFMDSLRSGIWLMKSNLIVSLEAGFIVFVISFILGFLILMVLAAVAIPFIFLLFVFSKLSFDLGMLFLLIAGIFVVFLLIVVTGGMLGAFTEAYWTLVFLKIAKDNPKSYIISFLSKT